MRSLIASLSVLVAGCAIQTAVDPIPPLSPVGEICIVENPKVIVKDFVLVLQSGIARAGFTSTVYRDIPVGCSYRLEYVAFQRWDVTTFLSEARVILYRGAQPVGSLSYKTPAWALGSGGNSEKWKSTKEKLDPLIDELFRNVSAH